MCSEIERLFVEQFIRRERRERLLHELDNPKKRSTAIARFCHRSNELLRMDKVVYCGNDLDEDKIEALRLGRCRQNECHIIAYVHYLDGKVLPWQEAWKLICGNGMPAIMIFNGFAVIETEQEQGPAEKIVLAL